MTSNTMLVMSTELDTCQPNLKWLLQKLFQETYTYLIFERINDSEQLKYVMRMEGHDAEGYGLSWNKNEIGVLLSGSNDGII